MSKIKEAFWDEIEAQEDIIDDIRTNGYVHQCEMPAQKTTMADVKPREVAYPIIWQEEQSELVREWLKANHATKASIREIKKQNGSIYELITTAKLSWGEMTPAKMQVVREGEWLFEEGKEYTATELLGRKDEIWQ